MNPRGSDAGDEAVQRTPWGVSLAYGQFSATLRFDDAPDMRVKQHLVSARLSYSFDDGWYLAGALGAVVDGALFNETRSLHFRPGFVGTLQAGVLVMRGQGALPFIESSINLSVSHGALLDDADTASSWTAIDVRLGATTGWRIADVWVPYVALRVFGGPVLWREGGVERVGSDSHHFQVAVGSTLSVFGVDLFVDWGLPIGESGLAAGVALQF